jgi:hypothetical protein
METILSVLFSGGGILIIQYFIRKTKERTFKYDIFISYPMKAIIDSNEKKELEDIILQTKDILTDQHKKLKIFASIDDKIKSGKKLTQETLNFEALRGSKCFILIYPKEVASSVLIEAGCALGLNKRTIIFTKDEKELPYLIRIKAKINKNNNIILLEYNNNNDLKSLICEIVEELIIKNNGRNKK